MMNSTEISALLRSDPVSNKDFLGVFAIDKLPEIGQEICSLVANLDPSDSPGTHWVGMYFYNNSCDYFDSFGLKPNTILKQFMLTYVDKILYSVKQVQGVLTSTCGQMCIYFLIWRSRKIPFIDILKSLDSSYADEFVTHFVNKMFRVNTVVFYDV